MLHIIPEVKKMEYLPGFFDKKGVFCADALDWRLATALEKLPYDRAGAKLEICLEGSSGEAYELWIDTDAVRIKADSAAGAFYAIQTLRQIFRHDRIPCLHIQDQPDFAYRGFYHDVTRGKVPTVNTTKELIDLMAYYKLNSLQLYVEHSFEFEEYREVIASTGFLTKDDLREIGQYCQQNFIEFIPSLSTFGHLYELLQQEQYQHLRALKEYTAAEEPNFWRARMIHHTIDPHDPESLELIKSLIDQYVPLFTSNTFNICCDETFDLHACVQPTEDEGRLYVDFVKKIIDHVKGLGKQVMMWGDILLKHPETIDELPADTCFLNWNYSAAPPEENVIRFAQSGRAQIVCPGTSSWRRFCERVDQEEKNICNMAEYGHRHGAFGMLNTNWGDYGNLASLELAMYGMVLGAEKSWSASTQIDEKFYQAVDFLLYGSEGGVSRLKELSRLQDSLDWRHFCYHYYGTAYDGTLPSAIKCDIGTIQNNYRSIADKLSREIWGQDEFRQEMLLAAEGICVVAELYAVSRGDDFSRITDTERWLCKYRQAWTRKNKESELCHIERLLLSCEKTRFCREVGAESGRLYNTKPASGD